MEEIVIEILPSGNVRCLYTDEIDLRAIGPMQLKKASSVYFEDDTQTFRFQLLETGEVFGPFKTRAEAVQAEREEIQERIRRNQCHWQGRRF